MYFYIYVTAIYLYVGNQAWLYQSGHLRSEKRAWCTVPYCIYLNGFALVYFYCLLALAQCVWRVAETDTFVLINDHGSATVRTVLL